MAASDGQTKTARDQAIKKTVHDIELARIMLFFAMQNVQDKRQEMMERLELANHRITTGDPMKDNLLMSIAKMDRAFHREQRTSAQVPTWERRLERNIEKLKDLKRAEEMERAEELNEV